MIIHIPHASTHIPDEYRKTIILNDADLQKELVLLTDAFCDELYAMENAVIITASVSRYVCDMERFQEDEKEPCAKNGQGLLYTHTLDGRLLRSPDKALREKVIKEYYNPHHKKLTQAVDTALKNHGECLIVDGHSFSGSPETADFCIGTDDFHTPKELQDKLCEKIEELGYSYALNHPYSGTIVPMKHYRKDKRVTSIMLETNRRLYQLDGCIKKNENFEEIKHICRLLLGALAK